jgi:hypothetical protein
MACGSENCKPSPVNPTSANEKEALRTKVTGNKLKKPIRKPSIKRRIA